SSLATFSLSDCSPAISSTIGATMRHGPHHVAQKSTSTGCEADRTSSLKLLSFTATADPAIGFKFLQGCGARPVEGSWPGREGPSSSEIIGSPLPSVDINDQ